MVNEKPISKLQMLNDSIEEMESIFKKEWSETEKNKYYESLEDHYALWRKFRNEEIDKRNKAIK